MSDQGESGTDRRCTNCGKAFDDPSYELTLFHTCRSCAVEPAPARWSAGMAPGTSVKWAYVPRWHLDERGAQIVADGGVSRDDLKECWCCDGLHDSPGTLCPDCDNAGCNRFEDGCESDHKPALADGGQPDGGIDR